MDATVLFADLAGYSALTEAHGDESAADLLARFYAIARAAVGADGRLVKTIGDAVMIVAGDPSAASSIAVRLASAAHTEPSFPAVRIGLHAGPVVERDGDVFGATVNLAARVVAHARAGQILCTSQVVQALAEAGAPARACGSASFKNITEPVQLFEIDASDSSLAHCVIDPVCRMRVDPETAPDRVDLEGEVVYFCSAGCLEAFTRAPHSYRRGSKARSL